MAQLRANNLAKAYRGREVIQDVSVAIDSGQIVGLLGPNGAGKTTCFYMIIGIIPADRGTITVNDEDITNLTMHERARRGVGYLPQEASIFRKLTVGDNIMAILETRSDLNKKQRLARCDELLAEFNVQHLRDSLGQSCTCVIAVSAYSSPITMCATRWTSVKRPTSWVRVVSSPLAPPKMC